MNLHAQLNMLGGLMVILIGAALSLLPGGFRSTRSMLVGVGAGMAVYYAGGIAFAAVAAHRVVERRVVRRCGRALEPWQALVLVPAALAVAVGFGAYGRAAWRATAVYRAEGGGGSGARPRRTPVASRSAFADVGLRRRCLRSAHGPARVPRARLALRGLSACRIGAPADRSGNRLGSDSACIHALRERSATPGRVASRVDLAAGEHVGLDGPPVSRTSPEALASARLTATTADG